MAGTRSVHAASWGYGADAPDGTPTALGPENGDGDPENGEARPSELLQDVQRRMGGADAHSRWSMTCDGGVCAAIARSSGCTVGESALTTAGAAAPGAGADGEGSGGRLGGGGGRPAKTGNVWKASSSCEAREARRERAGGAGGGGSAVPVPSSTEAPSALAGVESEGAARALGGGGAQKACGGCWLSGLLLSEPPLLAYGLRSCGSVVAWRKREGRRIWVDEADRCLWSPAGVEGLPGVRTFGNQRPGLGLPAAASIVPALPFESLRRCACRLRSPPPSPQLPPPSPLAAHTSTGGGATRAASPGDSGVGGVVDGEHSVHASRPRAAGGDGSAATAAACSSDLPGTDARSATTASLGQMASDESSAQLEVVESLSVTEAGDDRTTAGSEDGA